MKVFNFTDGVKGELLGDIKVSSAHSGGHVEKNGVNYKVELANPANVKPVSGGKSGAEWTWHHAVEHRVDGETKDITAEDFGVGAICFCTGEYYVAWYAGHPEVQTEWWWTVVGTNDWNREACKSGILKATKI